LPLFAEGALPERGLYWEYGNVQAYREGNWKLIRFNKKGNIEVMLFNLENDPNERTNLAEKNPEIVLQLTKKAMASRTTSNDFPSFLDKEGM
jgi:arylsulfatase A-like enzyme